MRYLILIGVDTYIFQKRLLIAMLGKIPEVPQWRNVYRKCGIFTQWNTTQQLKKWIYEIFRQIVRT